MPLREEIPKFTVFVEQRRTVRPQRLSIETEFAMELALPAGYIRRRNGMSKQLVCIGGVALGTKAASRFKRLMPDATALILEESAVFSVGACGIPYYISGEVAALDSLRATGNGVVRDEAYFRERRKVEVKSLTRAIAIDRKAKTVLVEHVHSKEQQTIPYDTLVLGTGANARVPQIPGADLQGVTAATKLDQAAFIHAACKSGAVKRAVVVGGGFIGLEMAVALAGSWGIETSLVEFLPQVMAAQLSPAFADMVQHDLELNGVKVYTDEKVEALEGKDGHVRLVRTSKREIETDLVIFAVGFTPNTHLAKEAGLTLDERAGAVLVDAFMRTSDPDIYAGGDCVAVRHSITGKPAYLPLGSLANRQGRVIGDNAAGRSSRFSGVVGNWIVKLFDMTASGVGLNLAQAKAQGFDAISASVEQHDRAHYYPIKTLMSLELVVESPSGRVLGLQGVSAAGDALKARIDAVATLLQYGRPSLEDIANLEVSYTPPFAAAMDVVNSVANVAANVLEKRLNTMTSDTFSAKWEARQSNKMLVVDVRPAGTGAEIEAKYPENWRCLPLEKLAEACKDLPRDRELVIMCNVGQRSYDAQMELACRDIACTHVQGGMQCLMKRGKTP